MEKQILITYDPDTVGLDDGNDLLGYLVNEFNNNGIRTKIEVLPDNDILYDQYAKAYIAAHAVRNCDVDRRDLDEDEESTTEALCHVLGRQA